MSDAAVPVEAGKIDIGRVIGQTFGVLRRNFVTFFLLSLLLSGFPLTLFSMAQSLALDPVAGQFNADYVQWWLMGFLVFVITATILQATLIHTTVQDLSGNTATLGESLAVGLRAFLPLIGLGVLLTLGVAFGLLLLIVPGIMLMVAWMVAAPAFIMDRTGVIGAFGRSAQLTRGNRWRIFGLLVILYVAMIVLSLIISTVTGFNAMNPGTDAEAIRTIQLSPLYLGLNALNQTLAGMVSAAGVAVLYVELRRAREGMGAQSLAEVFA